MSTEVVAATTTEVAEDIEYDEVVFVIMTKSQAQPSQKLEFELPPYMYRDEEGFLRSKSSNLRAFRGIASADVVDMQRERIDLDKLRKDMEIVEKMGGVILYNHMNLVLGKMLGWGDIIVDIVEDGGNTPHSVQGVYIDFEVFDYYDTHKDILRRMDLPPQDPQAISMLSIGGIKKHRERECEGDTCYIRVKPETHEISLTERGANFTSVIFGKRDTTMTNSKSVTAPAGQQEPDCGGGCNDNKEDKQLAKMTAEAEKDEGTSSSEGASTESEGTTLTKEEKEGDDDTEEEEESDESMEKTVLNLLKEMREEQKTLRAEINALKKATLPPPEPPKEIEHEGYRYVLATPHGASATAEGSGQQPMNKNDGKNNGLPGSLDEFSASAATNVVITPTLVPHAQQIQVDMQKKNTEDNETVTFGKMSDMQIRDTIAERFDKIGMGMNARQKLEQLGIVLQD